MLWVLSLYKEKEFSFYIFCFTDTEYGHKCRLERKYGWKREKEFKLFLSVFFACFVQHVCFVAQFQQFRQVISRNLQFVFFFRSVFHFIHIRLTNFGRSFSSPSPALSVGFINHLSTTSKHRFKFNIFYSMCIVYIESYIFLYVWLESTKAGWWTSYRNFTIMCPLFFFRKYWTEFNWNTSYTRETLPIAFVVIVFLLCELIFRIYFRQRSSSTYWTAERKKKKYPNNHDKQNDITSEIACWEETRTSTSKTKAEIQKKWRNT